jgi:hypothetical protein
MGLFKRKLNQLGADSTPERRCQLNSSMQHPITNCNRNTSRGESICAAALNQNLTRICDLFELTPTNEINLVDYINDGCEAVLRRPIETTGLIEMWEFGQSGLRATFLEAIDRVLHRRET